MDLLCSRMKISKQIECEKLCKIFFSVGNFLSSHFISISSPSPKSSCTVFYFVGPGHSSPFMYFIVSYSKSFCLHIYVCKAHTAYEGIFLDFLYDRKKSSVAYFTYMTIAHDRKIESESLYA